MSSFPPESWAGITCSFLWIPRKGLFQLSKKNHYFTVATMALVGVRAHRQIRAKRRTQVSLREARSPQKSGRAGGPDCNKAAQAWPGEEGRWPGLPSL